MHRSDRPVSQEAGLGAVEARLELFGQVKASVDRDDFHPVPPTTKQIDAAIILGNRAVSGHRNAHQMGQIRPIDHVVGHDRDPPAEVVRRKPLEGRESPVDDGLERLSAQVSAR